MGRTFKASQRLLLLRKANFCCAVCGTSLTNENFAADHKFPFSKGGKTEVWNGQALCITCNSRKGDSVAEAMADGDR